MFLCGGARPSQQSRSQLQLIIAGNGHRAEERRPRAGGVAGELAFGCSRGMPRGSVITRGGGQRVLPMEIWKKNLSAAKFPVGFYKSQMNGRSLEGINGDVVKRCGCKQFGNDFVIVNQFTLTKECY